MTIKSIEITRITFIIAGCCIIAAGLDSGQHIAMAETWTNVPSKMMITARPRLPDVRRVIHRDPFSGAPATDNPEQTNARSSHSGQPNGPTIPLNLGRVPNAGQINIQQGPSTPIFGPEAMRVPNAGTITPNNGALSGEITVIATMIGDGRKPLALIANGNSRDIVGIGDSLGSHKIRRIVTQGIEFEDGQRLSVSAVKRDGQTYTSPNTPTGQQMTTTSSQQSSGQQSPTTSASPPPTPTPANGVPIINPSPYNFGPLPTPAPGTTPAPINRLYTPQPSTPKTGP